MYWSLWLLGHFNDAVSITEFIYGQIRLEDQEWGAGKVWNEAIEA